CLFFFQAEDGIRAFHVTGVQTCALPIFPSKIGYVLGISNKDLEKIIYYETYVVVNPGKTNHKKMDFITEEEYNEILDGMTEEEQIGRASCRTRMKIGRDEGEVRSKCD